MATGCRKRNAIWVKVINSSWLTAWSTALSPYIWQKAFDKKEQAWGVCYHIISNSITHWKIFKDFFRYGIYGTPLVSEVTYRCYLAAATYIIRWTQSCMLGVPIVRHRPCVAQWFDSRPCHTKDVKTGRFALLSLALGINGLGNRLGGSESV